MLILIALTIMSTEIRAQYDTTRIFKALAKARRGENVTVGVIGSSITAGSLATSVETRYTNLMADWWKTTFPQSKITLINAGIGGAKSDIGAHRVQIDLLKYKPDFVVYEFINDVEGDYAVKMMEGLTRQLLVDDSLPGVMMLVLKQVSGITPLASHKQVADYYKVPLINFPTLIDSAVAKDGISLASIYADGFLHPNDIGMAYIADFINAELTRIYNVLPADSLIDTVNTELPAPLKTDTYDHTYLYSNSSIVPSANKGWEVNNSGWIGHNPDDEISFIVDGNAISITYTQYNTSNLGQAEVWVDNGTHVTLDGHFNENWGPAVRFALIAEGLADGDHTLHIKITGNNSSGSTGHDFQLLNVLKAGKFRSASPIANAGNNIKTLINETVQLVGFATDPENDPLQDYTWSIVSKPVGSVNAIINGSNDTASFIPDISGFYILGFTVSDGTSTSITSNKTIHAVASNQAPAANAGNDSTVATMKFCSLNGNNSTDSDNDPLFFYWRIISQPAGSSIILNNPNTSTPNFRPRIEGEYRIGLVVNDSLLSSAEDEIIITAIANYTSVSEDIQQEPQLTIYPNPLINQLNINYYQATSGRSEISIYDITGKKLTDLITDYKDEGTQNCSFILDSKLFKSGIYFLVLQNNNNSYLSKFIIK